MLRYLQTRNCKSVHAFSHHSSGALRLLVLPVKRLQFHINRSRLIPSATVSSEAPLKVQLRPYQEDSIQSVLSYLGRGQRRLGISLATGSGKTVIFSHLIERVPAPNSECTQTLILAHRRELVEQAASHCRRLYPDKSVELELGGQHASGRADITVASIQSLMSATRFWKYDPKRFKLLLVDEAHHIVAAQYLDALAHFGLVETGSSYGQRNTETLLVGVSATFSRHDGLGLGKAIDHIVYHKDYVDMIEDSWLSDATFTTVQSGANLSGVRSARGDFQTGALSQAVNRDDINEITVGTWFTKARDRKSTLVFCVDLAHVASLTAKFRERGIDARFVTSETSSKVRGEQLDAFKQGQFPVLLNCGIFTEGTDIPNIDCVLLARPTQSRGLLQQMIGRGLRKTAGKENCHIIDMVASLKTGIVTTPTLYGLDPAEIVENASAKDLKDLRARKDLEMEAQVPVRVTAGRVEALEGNVTFTDYDTVTDLIEDTRGDRHIRAISSFGWVEVGSGVYILGSRNGDYITLIRVSGNETLRGVSRYTTRPWYFTYHQRIQDPGRKGKAPYMPSRIVAEMESWRDAIHAADSFAKAKFPNDFINKAAKWRAYAASEGQLKFLNRCKEESDHLQPGSITKGRAADMITKLVHGAKGRFERMQVTKRSAESEKAKEDDMGRRKRLTEVKVGPVEM